jgi:hypothetical protein
VPDRREEVIRAVARRLKVDPFVPALDAHAWYVSIAIERTIEVPESELGDSPFMWIRPQKCIELRDQLQPELHRSLEIAATFTASLVAPTQFEQVVIRDRMVFFAQDREPFRLPSMEASATAALSRGADFDPTPLRSALEAAADLPETDVKWLPEVGRWHVLALVEPDGVKKFLWAHLGLEIFANNAFKKIYALGKAALDDVEDATLLAAHPSLPVDVMRGPKKKLGVRGRFAFFAWVCLPGEFESLFSAFEVARRARNELAHGSIENLGTLPVGEALQVLETVQSYATQHWL